MRYYCCSQLIKLFFFSWFPAACCCRLLSSAEPLRSIFPPPDVFFKHCLHFSPDEDAFRYTLYFHSSASVVTSTPSTIRNIQRTLKTSTTSCPNQTPLFKSSDVQSVRTQCFRSDNTHTHTRAASGTMSCFKTVFG